MAMALSKDNISARLISFGTPRFGDHNFAQLSNKLLPDALRVVYNRDEIPHLMNPRSQGWHHSFCEIFIEANGDMTKSHDMRESESLSNQWEDRTPERHPKTKKCLPWYSFNDHLPEAYS